MHTYIYRYIHTYTRARFPSLIGLRLRAFSAQPPSELYFYACSAMQFSFSHAALHKSFINLTWDEEKKLSNCSSAQKCLNKLSLLKLFCILSKNCISFTLFYDRILLEPLLHLVPLIVHRNPEEAWRCRAQSHREGLRRVALGQS